MKSKKRNKQKKLKEKAMKKIYTNKKQDDSE